jgi:hypothetical protein
MIPDTMRLLAMPVHGNKSIWSVEKETPLLCVGWLIHFQ